MFFNKNILLSIIFIVYSSLLNAQQDSDYISAGVSINIPKNHKIAILGGYSPTDNIQMFRIDPNFRINKYLSLSPSYMYRNYYTNENSEHQIMAIGNLTFPISKNNKWRLSNRSMYAHRFRKQKNNNSFLRHRLGLTYRTSIFNKEFDFHLYDEIYFNLEEKLINRNQISFGTDIKLPWLTHQILYSYQINKSTPNKHIITFTFIVPLENFGIFNKK